MPGLANINYRFRLACVGLEMIKSFEFLAGEPHNWLVTSLMVAAAAAEAEPSPLGPKSFFYEFLTSS